MKRTLETHFLYLLEIDPGFGEKQRVVHEVFRAAMAVLSEGGSLRCPLFAPTINLYSMASEPGLMTKNQAMLIMEPLGYILCNVSCHHRPFWEGLGRLRQVYSLVGVVL